MKIADYVIELLNKNGVDTIFGYLGGYNADILDYFCEKKGNKFVLNYHEQASAFACNTYSIIGERLGVSTASGAPSACNLVAGIANAYFDSHASLFLIGSAHSLSTRTTKEIRQNAFEEIDMVALTSDITKYSVKITDPKEVRYELEKAIHLANEGRKGPVVVDIPYDISRSEADIDSLRAFEIPNVPKFDDPDILKIKEFLENAKRPVILLGGGARSEKTRHLVKQLLKIIKIPAVASLCGLDVLSHNHECFCGFIGHYGNRYANYTLANSDCIIILGSRLDERQLGGYRTKFDKNCKVVRVEIEKAELGRKIHETLSYYSSVDNFLEKLLSQNYVNCDYSKWFEIIKTWKNRYPSYDFKDEQLAGNNFLHILSDYLPKDAIISADVGQNQMSVAQTLKLDDERRLLNSAGYGSMGFSLPAAIGASYAKKGTCVVSINGDGGIQMNIQELQTLKRDNLPINVIVLNNNCLGMIRRLQENMFGNRTNISVDGYAAPDFAGIAKGYGIDYLKIENFDDCKKLDEFIGSHKPTFIEVMLPLSLKNEPEPGTVIDKQTPLVQDFVAHAIKKECNFV